MYQFVKGRCGKQILLRVTKEDGEEKKLLINTDPAVRTYKFHGFFHAITAAEDKVDTLAAEISVEKFEDYVWNQQTDRLECCYDGQNGRIRFLSNQWNIGMNHCFWRNNSCSARIQSLLFIMI